MFELDENIPVAKLRIAAIGKALTKLKNYLDSTGIALLEYPLEQASWSELDVVFLIADASEEYAFEKFQ